MKARMEAPIILTRIVRKPEFMMQSWQLQDAKARLSKLVKCAQSHPQDITVHGQSVAVVLSREAFDRLSSQQQSLVEFMRSSPLYDTDDIHFDREPGLTRDIDL
ncbi:MAG: type II toxin-antitoxin system Phd/YefM family antitoxin [Pseudohongiella sp.]|uniref:type II toxin-antitoxin system Phd/YefM family antitoxin n=1 Tax=Pseudohongiella sp. TaxID=1979412 RepID=UPI00349FECE7